MAVPFRTPTIIIQNTATNVQQNTTTNGSGIYTLPTVLPGVYRLTVEAPGFERKVVEGIKVDASVSTVVDRQFVENMPLNGRSFQSLLTMVPGVNIVPSDGTGYSGEVSVNGQRTEANYYVIDGVSANTGAVTITNSSAVGKGASFSGSTSTQSALGTTQSLVSVDALQEFRATTSTYSAEYGRTPGGQFSFTTRSGTNDWHGSPYEISDR